MSPPPMAEKHHIHGVAIAASHGHHGIALWPPPSDHPKDPLRWPRRTKVLALISVALFNFTANFAGAGFSVATQVLQMQFHKSASEVNSLLTFNFLLLGLGNLIWVPLSAKFGKRSILLIAMALLFSVLCWTAKAKTFNSLLAARCISGFASSAGESIVPGIVSDLFFLHERASMMSIYVILISSATAIGPLIGSFVVAKSPGTWRDFSWVCAGIAGLNLLMIFFLYPDSTFHRPGTSAREFQDHLSRVNTIEEERRKDMELGHSEHEEEHAQETGLGVQKVNHIKMQWLKVWTSFFRVDPTVRLPIAFLRGPLLLACPAVSWTVFVYGSSLAAQAICIFAFPSLLLAPPYLFAAEDIGLIEIAAVIGFVIACFGGGMLSDIITSWRIRKEGNHFYPEQRLWSIIPGWWIAPLGCIIVAITCSEKLSWIGIAFGFAMLSFGTVFLPNIAVTYITDCYPNFASDCLVTISAAKNLVAFIFLYVAVDWIQAQGWVQVYMIMFMLTMIAPLLGIPMYFWGERLRERTLGIANWGHKLGEGSS